MVLLLRRHGTNRKSPRGEPLFDCTKAPVGIDLSFPKPPPVEGRSPLPAFTEDICRFSVCRVLAAVPSAVFQSLTGQALDHFIVLSCQD